MSNLDILIVFVGVCIAGYIWYRWGGGKAFLAQYETQVDYGCGGT